MSSRFNVLATRHLIHAWKILYAACTEITSWWWTCLFETCRAVFLKRQVTARYWGLVSIIPGREKP